MKSSSWKRPVVVAAAALIAVLGCSAAYGYWTAKGSGTGTASTGDWLSVTLSPGAPTAALYPGGQTDVSLTATNPNTSAVRINALSLNTTKGTNGFDVDAGHAGCTTSSLSFATQTNGGNGWSVPGKVGATDGSLPITLPNALTMSVDAPNACQGATFTVYLAAS